MSQTSLQDTGGRALDVSSRPNTSRRSGSRVRKSTPPAAVAISSVALETVCSHRSDRRAVPALMDLAFPRFADPEDRRRVIRIRDVPPEVQVVSFAQDHQVCDSRWAVWGAEHPTDIPGGNSQQPVSVVALPPEVRTSVIPPGVGAEDLTPVVRAEDVPPVGRMETVQPATPPDVVQMSPNSTQTITFKNITNSSMPMSPNRVRVENSQDIQDDGTLFDVSPVTPRFLMRPSGTAVPTPVVCLPLPQTLDTFSDPVLGDPIAFAQCALVPGSDTPMTLPVYTMPSGLAFMPGQSSVQTVMASAVSSRPEGWSSGRPRTLGVSREGPFDAYASPMDMEDSPLVMTGLPGCPYRITSYTGPALADTNPAFGIQLHHPRFMEFIGAPESARLVYNSPAFWVQRFGEEDAMAAAVNLQRDAGTSFWKTCICAIWTTCGCSYHICS